MRPISIFTISLSILLLFTALFLGACKKEKLLSDKGKDTTGKEIIDTVIKVDTGIKRPPVTLPDEVMFVGSTQVLDSNRYTIFVLNAATGQQVTRYDYPNDGHSNFCRPFVGNGLLYDVERNKINAITMNTGAILWTDNVGMDTDDASIILHGDTFYGINYNHTGTPGGTYVYALDATKPSTKFLWKVPITLGGNVYNIPIDYYNGMIYVNDLDGRRVTALDAATGVTKWSATSSGVVFSLASLNIGVIIQGLSVIDAASGRQIANVTVPPLPLIAAGATAVSSLNYVTGDLYFVRTTQAAGPLQRSFLSAVDRASGAEKWRAGIGSNIVDSSTVSAVDSTKDIRFVWNNKLIVEGSVKTYSGRSPKFGLPILTGITGGFSTLDLGTGMFDNITGGEIRYAVGYAVNFDKGNFITNDTMYGNYSPAQGSGINLYAIDLSTRQLKWKSLSLSYSGIYDVFTCVFSKSQNKAYSPSTR